MSEEPNVQFIEYDPHTGDIIKYGHCSPAVYPPPRDGDGEYMLVDAALNPLAYKVDLTTMKIIPK